MWRERERMRERDIYIYIYLYVYVGLNKLYILGIYIYRFIQGV